MKNKHKHSRYPGQPDWIDKEFPMYTNSEGDTTWWYLGKMFEKARTVYNDYIEGFSHYNSEKAALNELVPIYEPHWNTLVAYWNDDETFVRLGVYWNLDEFLRRYVVVIIPDHILKLPEPPTDILTWQEMLDNGELEVIR